MLLLVAQSALLPLHQTHNELAKGREIHRAGVGSIGIRPGALHDVHPIAPDSVDQRIDTIFGARTSHRAACRTFVGPTLKFSKMGDYPSHKAIGAVRIVIANGCAACAHLEIDRQWIGIVEWFSN